LGKGLVLRVLYAQDTISKALNESMPLSRPGVLYYAGKIQKRSRGFFVCRGLALLIQLAFNNTVRIDGQSCQSPLCRIAMPVVGEVAVTLNMARWGGIDVQGTRTFLPSLICHDSLGFLESQSLPATKADILE
jgi:hypothetical protein